MCLVSSVMMRCGVHVVAALESPAAMRSASPSLMKPGVVAQLAHLREAVGRPTAEWARDAARRRWGPPSLWISHDFHAHVAQKVQPGSGGRRRKAGRTTTRRLAPRMASTSTMLAQRRPGTSVMRSAVWKGPRMSVGALGRQHGFHAVGELGGRLAPPSAMRSFTPRYSAGLWLLVSMMPPTASSSCATDQHSVGVGQ